MNTKELIGTSIKDILLWSKLEVGGIDEAEVFIKLTNDKTVKIPWSSTSENIETKLKSGAQSLIQKAKNKIKIDTIEYNFPEGKTWNDIQKEVEEHQKSSLFGRLKYMIGIKNKIPKEYIIETITYQDNTIKKLENEKIVDFLIFEDADSVGFLELENGNLLSETITAPHGTGMAGLVFFENIQEFESHCGTDYKRLQNNQR
ncbi:hypothetical protein [Kordia jejudonensis]|uniref:hypothetical protein n=1 Tax=Kordia jejudonensis TaxID=1348245 RepID=UPI0006292FE7|nr:hypothetical protein [Kordia jejudonensis]